MEIALETPDSNVSSQEIILDAVRKYRADCQAGHFKIGSSKVVGKSLDMEIVRAEVSEGEFFGYPQQKWLGIIFVDPDGVMSHILFKKESMDNFNNLRIDYRVKGETILGKIVRATMSKRTSRQNGASYYAVEFDVVGLGKFEKAIIDLRAQSVMLPQMLPRLELQSQAIKQ